MLIKHKEKCEQKQKITTIRASEESHLFWKNHFHKNPLCFRDISDFEAVIEIDDSTIGNKTTKTYKGNPVPNAYFIMSELHQILKSGYSESLLRYNNVD